MNNQDYIDNIVSCMKQSFICQSIVKDFFDDKTEKAYCFYKEFFDSYMKKCESPIEKLMCAILFQLEIFFTPQVKIKYYTVDFLIDLSVGKNSDYIVIECDGHDFHEKTKEQAKHDKERDRFLQKEGYPVYRFTGSEIFNNPLKVLNEINEIVYSRTNMEKHYA